MFVGTDMPVHRKLSRANATILSILIVATAIVLFVAGGLVGADPEWFRPALHGVASAALGIGVVSVLYDLRLRQTVEDELLRLVGIERSLAKVGLAGAGDPRTIDWGRLLGGASQIRVLMADPIGWVSSNWNGMLAGRAKRAVTIDLYFPDPDGPMVPIIARYLRSHEDDIRSSLNRALELAEEGWKAAMREGRLAKGSLIRVSWIDEFPAYSIVEADDHTLIILPPSTGRPPTEPGFALGFRKTGDNELLHWVDASWAGAKARTVYETQVGDKE